MQARISMARDALSRALVVRSNLKISLYEPIDVFDVAHKLDIEVRFADVATLEGMYQKQPNPVIVVSALRPPGRQAFTCAHEIGHHVYDHGLKMDDVLELHVLGRRIFRAEEFIADCFGAFLLMPPTAIRSAFVKRGWKPSEGTPEQFFTIATEFGVGYASLITHLNVMMRDIPDSVSERLLKHKPKSIRIALLEGVVGNTSGSYLSIVDQYWGNEKLSVCTGDYILAPLSTMCDKDCVEHLTGSMLGEIFRAKQPGIGELFIPQLSRPVQVRVSRRNFTGRSIYRHLEEADE
jgi:Zn-dependent peptidase ImmA (M78 family)